MGDVAFQAVKRLHLWRCAASSPRQFVNRSGAGHIRAGTRLVPHSGLSCEHPHQGFRASWAPLCGVSEIHHAPAP